MNPDLQDRVEAYRQQTFRLVTDRRLQSAEAAVQFVNERGFVYLWPIKDILFPSLWTAVVGNRPVASDHDDPGHITWRWKDEMLGKGQWHYAKVLRGKATMISLQLLPTFYALSDNYGDPENDYLQLYEDGLLSREAKLIYETLLREGPLDTVTLRRQISMTGKKSNSPFDRGLTVLQRDFKIMPVGVAEAGAWRYSFVYQTVHSYYPELLEQARPLTRQDARQTLVQHYFRAVGAAGADDVRKLFQWKPREVQRTLTVLLERGFLRLVNENYVLAELVR